MDPTLNSKAKRKGQALVEAVIFLPFYALTIYGFVQLHGVVTDEFKSLRQLRKLATSLSTNSPEKIFDSQERKNIIRIDIQHQWPDSNFKHSTQETPEGLGRPTLKNRFPLPRLFLDNLFKPKTVTLTKKQRGLWPDKSYQATRLEPSDLRTRGHFFAKLIALGGIFR